VHEVANVRDGNCY